jgi:SAM-dependent methyltransferase
VSAPVSITWQSDEPAPVTCTACGALDRSRKVAVVSHHETTFDLVRCGDCRSLQVVGAGGSFEDIAGDAVDDQAELGVGIEGAVEPLGWLGDELGQIRSYVEVGCGFGWVLDFAMRSWGWRCVGIDPGSPAKAGAAALGLDVRPSYIDDAADVTAADLVYACEVIEHVGDQVAFASAIRSRLDERGIFLLRTPAAEAVNPEATAATLHEALSVPHHRVLLSEPGLRSVLRRAGFTHVDVLRDGATWHAAAAMRPLAWPVRRSLEDAVVQWAVARVDELTDSTPLRTGLLYVLSKRYVYAGDYRTGEMWVTRLWENLRRRHGVTRDACTGEWRTASAVPPPPVIVGALFLAAMLELNAHGRRRVAAELFLASGRAARAQLATDQGPAGEVLGLLWPAELHGAVMLSETDLDAATEVIRRAVDDDPSPAVRRQRRVSALATAAGLGAHDMVGVLIREVPELAAMSGDDLGRIAAAATALAP